MSVQDYFPQLGLTRQQIINRLVHLRVNITTPVAELFAADVPATHRRYITNITLTNDNNTPTSVRLRRVDVDGTFTDWFPDYNVLGLETVDMNKAVDQLANPLYMLTRGQNLDGLRNGTIDIDAVLTWYDVPRN